MYISEPKVSFSSFEKFFNFSTELFRKNNNRQSAAEIKKKSKEKMRLLVFILLTVESKTTLPIECQGP